MRRNFQAWIIGFNEAGAKKPRNSSMVMMRFRPLPIALQ